MNLREGTRRLALLLGVVGAILGGVASYFQLQSTMRQRADHKRFEQLVNSEVVRQERDRRFAPLKDAKTGRPSIDPKNGTPTDPIAEFINLPREQQLSTLQQLSPEKQDALLGKVKEYRSRQKQLMVDWDEVEPINGPHNPKSENGFAEPPSEVNKQGIKNIYWTRNLGVSSIETEDSDTLYPTPAPSAWPYVLIALLPLFGFFIPWGAVRAVGWVGAGFVAGSR